MTEVSYLHIGEKSVHKEVNFWNKFTTFLLGKPGKVVLLITAVVLVILIFIFTTSTCFLAIGAGVLTGTVACELIVEMLVSHIKNQHHKTTEVSPQKSAINKPDQQWVVKTLDPFPTKPEPEKPNNDSNSDKVPQDLRSKEIDLKTDLKTWSDCSESSSEDLEDQSGLVPIFLRGELYYSFKKITQNKGPLYKKIVPRMIDDAISKIMASIGFPPKS